LIPIWLACQSCMKSYTDWYTHSYKCRRTLRLRTAGQAARVRFSARPRIVSKSRLFYVTLHLGTRGVLASRFLGRRLRKHQKKAIPQKLLKYHIVNQVVMMTSRGTDCSPSKMKRRTLILLLILHTFQSCTSPTLSPSLARCVRPPRGCPPPRGHPTSTWA
jgi:hypothetical protein